MTPTERMSSLPCSLTASLILHVAPQRRKASTSPSGRRHYSIILSTRPRSQSGVFCQAPRRLQELETTQFRDQSDGQIGGLFLAQRIAPIYATDLADPGADNRRRSWIRGRTLAPAVENHACV